MTKRIQKGFAAAFACAVAIVLAAGVMPQSAWAAVSAVYTATAVPSYENPATGEIEDSGGSSNAALGESMVTSATKDVALVETDTDGATFVTLRIGLIDQIESVGVEVSSDGGSSFSSVDVEEMQRDESYGEASPDNTADFRFEAPGSDAVMRVSLDVVPMGREVVYFVSLADLAEGNDAGFVQTITPGEGEEDDAASAATAAGAADGDDQAADDSDADSKVNNDSSADGVSEFNAEGNKVEGDGASQSLDGGTIGMIVGIAAAVVVVGGIVVYAAYVRPKRAKEAAAAAAAAASAGDGKKGE